MKKAAIEACRMLAVWIIEGHSTMWETADRIERRWKIQGCTQSLIDQMQKQHAEFLRQQSAVHDQQHPDRKTYLHR